MTVTRINYLGACLLALLWLPIVTYAAEVTQVRSPLTEAAVFYSNELIVSFSALTSVLGATLVALAWIPPDDMDVPLQLESRWVRFLVGIAGGFAAFFYILHTSNKLILLQPVWVLGVSFVTPIALQVAYPTIVTVVSKTITRIFSGER